MYLSIYLYLYLYLYPPPFQVCLSFPVPCPSSQTARLQSPPCSEFPGDQHCAGCWEKVPSTGKTLALKQLTWGRDEAVAIAVGDSWQEVTPEQSLKGQAVIWEQKP